MKFNIKNFTVKNLGVLLIMGVVLFVLFVIFRIGLNIKEHKAYTNDFNQKCVEAGGWSYVPHGARGFSKSICFKKEAIIKI